MIAAIVLDPDGCVADVKWQRQLSPSTGTPVWSNIVGADGATQTPNIGDEGMVQRHHTVTARSLLQTHSLFRAFDVLSQ